ncbi:MAG: FmdB family zinc ribbon protein [Candidatus Cybelea sp.]|jgi:putative FmdB family regulatory protein
MPLYDYACTQCGRTFEVRHGFNETHQDPCADCGAPLRRVFNAAPVLFKGSGFYVTDSRRSSGGGKSEIAEKAEKAESPGKPEKAEKTEKTASEASAPAAPAKSESKASEPAA